MKYLFLLGSSLIVATPALAQEPTITVVASGHAQPISQTGQSITVIGADELDAIQGPDLTRVLERLPGVSLSRNGGLGSTTSLFVRGANSHQLLVLVDGVRMADASAPQGGFDLGHLLSGNVERIELLRGSNSVVWGSDAVGGVLAVTTRRETGARAAVEYGANDTLNASASAGLAGPRGSIGLHAGYARTDGFSAASLGAEPDGFEQWSIGGNGSLALGEAIVLVASARYAEDDLDIDGSDWAPPYAPVDALETQQTKIASGRVGFEADLGAVSLAGGYALSDTRRHYSAWGGSDYTGRSERADLTGHAGLPMNLTLDFGAAGEWTRAESTWETRKTARTLGLHALLGWHGDGIDVSAGARMDDHDRFGTHWTFGANGSVRLAGDVRLRASYGEGFRAPTLYELYGSWGVGNAALRPEESRSYDIGIEKGDREGPLHFALTAFRRDSRNLIVYADPWGPYYNVGRARAEGLELEADLRPVDRLSIHAAYTWSKTENRTPGDANAGNELARRPRHTVSLAVDWRTPLHDLTLGGDIRLVGDRFDRDDNVERLDGHALVTLRASLPVGERLELFGRIENLGDVRYELASGYATAGRSAFIGARARF